MATKIVKAKKVRAHSDSESGDFLPGLDSGYVIDVDKDYDVRGDYNVRLGGEEFVLITFNTSDGDEAYLLCPGDMPVTVDRR